MYNFCTGLHGRHRIVLNFPEQDPNGMAHRFLSSLQSHNILLYNFSYIPMTSPYRGQAYATYFCLSWSQSCGTRSLTCCMTLPHIDWEEGSLQNTLVFVSTHSTVQCLGKDVSLKHLSKLLNSLESVLVYTSIYI